MAWHQLKTWPEQFQSVMKGTKRHEVRINDRNFNVGDTLNLREFDPETSTYSGRAIEVRVTYITYGGSFGLSEYLCVMSILK